MNSTMDNDSFDCNNTTDAVGLLGNELTYAIAVPIPCIIMMMFGIFGNLLVIIVVATNKHMRSDINLLITNLAIIDLLFLICVMPFTALQYTYPSWPFGDFLCKFIRYVLYVTAWCSIYTMVLMSVIRFYAIMYPVRSINVLRTYYVVPTMIAVMWFIIMCINIPALLYHEVVEYVFDCQERSICELLPEYSTVFYLCFFIFGFLLPLVAISICYGFILYKLRQKTQIGELRSTETVQGRKRATYLVFTIVVVFAICWLPTHIVIFLDTYNVQLSLGLQSQLAIFVICNLMMALNSSLNPVLYSFLSENFREAFRKFFCKRRGHLLSQKSRRQASLSYAECPQHTCVTALDKRLSIL